ncbi:hypothetical protein MBLNU459_g6934t1 [Dothideomycetes sp. NU459]
MAEIDPAEALFFAVSFTIIPSDNITPAQENELISVLTQGGADFKPLRYDGRVDDFTAISHIISEHVDFPDYYNALDNNKHVVKPSWVFQSWQKKRQAQTRQHSPDPALFFRNVIVSCGDLPEADKDAIIAGVLAMGGLYSSPLTKLVTHIVSLSMDDEKCKVVTEKNLASKIVLPHWFDDCFKLGKCINEGPYTLPNPEILLMVEPEKHIRVRESPDLAGATSAVAGNPPSYQAQLSPSQTRKELVVFKDKKILFSKDLNVNEHLAKTLRLLVKQAGGSLTQAVDECDVYIGHYRDGLDYQTASRANKSVANLAWFYSVINRNRWTNPLGRLLHYPVPRCGIPGFKNMRISLSNYSGEARLYLENLIKESGAEFTKTMKQDNTHLITAHKHSEKCDAAEEWNINICNHLWLEESYAQCEVQSLTAQRFTCFPSRTNLTEVVGQTPIDLDKVRKRYFPDVKHGSRQPNGTASHPFRGAVKPAQVIPASSAAMASTALQPQADGRNGESAEPMDVVHEEAEEDAPAPHTVRKKRVGSDAAIRTPVAARQADEKENESPPTTGGRASKQAALNNIHKQKDDIALFQREMKRKGGVMYGGRKASTEPDSAKKAPAKGRKRTSEEIEANDDETSSEEDVQAGRGLGRPAKKAKPAREASADPPVKFHMMVSGDDRWLKNAKKEAVDSAKLRKLGIVLTPNPAECTLLCAPRILRTRKFVAALACAPEVVNIGYLDYALKHDTLQDTADYELADHLAEERFGFVLDDALDRAHENKRKLLHGWTIFCTDRIPGGFDTFEEIIKINGGVATPYRGRTGLVLPKRRLSPAEDPEAAAESQNSGGENEASTVYLISGTEDDEVRLWAKFRTLAEKQGLVARIVKSDWLLNLAMCQRVEWDEKWELREELVPGHRQKNGR